MKFTTANTGNKASTTCTTKAAHKSSSKPVARPKPPFAKQHQQLPGLESELNPRPRYQAPESSYITGTVLQVMGGTTSGG